MPIYQYECSGCGVNFEKRRALSDSDTGVTCPQCGAKSPRRLPSRFSSRIWSLLGMNPAANSGGRGRPT